MRRGSGSAKYRRGWLPRMVRPATEKKGARILTILSFPQKGSGFGIHRATNHRLGRLAKATPQSMLHS